VSVACPRSSRLFLVRHGQSAGNLADDDARRTRAERLVLQTRDMDVELSALGEEQALATAGWALGAQLVDPLVFASPYRRATRTAQLALRASPVRLDERLREREFGILDRLTRRGVEAIYPEQAAARAFLGKFYHRPPGGESWVDIALRIRMFFAELELELREEGSGRDVVIVTHQAVILVMRYVLERLDEQAVLEIDRLHQIPNCSVTTYGRSDGRWSLVEFASVRHLEPETITRASDYTGAPR
jgi:2,3-bisphosphoglycerate-dependent phosphoglycerate mutase